MEKLYEKLKIYNLNDAIKFEQEDRQFIALKNLWNTLNYKIINDYLSFIIVNSLICYQLSWKWEDYWEEFSISLSAYLNSSNTDILNFFTDFLHNSKNNKRFFNIKLKRVKKVLSFLDTFKNKEEYFYKNMQNLRDELAKTMNQKKDAKTIVFAVKMFSYWARTCFNSLEYFPADISIPIDSRLIKIFDKYSEKTDSIEIFYKILSQKLNIPELHLDWIIWNSKDLM